MPLRGACCAPDSADVMPLEVHHPEQALDWFLSLSQIERGRFLSTLSHNLTIAARCFFNAFEPEKSDAVRARAVNELLHRVTSYLQHIHAGDEKLSWAPFVTARLLEQSDPELRTQIHQAWHYAVEAKNA